MSEDNLTLKETAIAVHECFTSFLEAGFTRKEALELVKSMVAGTQK